MKKLIVFILITGIFSSFAYAGKKNNQREENQEKRIEAGVNSGQLNTNEATRLNNGQDRIDAAQDAGASNKKLDHMQNNQNRKIHKLKHNRK